ncbi:MAG TPA: hypothetical protein VHZ25_10910 [Acidobacteriaceae bacterium]|nr:hypothetical protein [Acidobacteriaceae bacterium]
MTKRNRWIVRAALSCVLLVAALSAEAQQTDVQHYDVYAGFAGFETPWLNLAQRGFHLQTGDNVRPWLAVGFDYSEATGHNSLTPQVLKPSLQQELAGEIGLLVQEGAIPANYQLVVPLHAFSQTFALGPQVEYRHFRQLTLFVRPSLGAIRQRVTPHTTDPVQAAVVAQLVPAGTKLDWQGFYGFGGGVEWNATSHFGIRAQADQVYWRLFNDLLAQGTWTTRFAGGVSYHFGRNIQAP